MILTVTLNVAIDKRYVVEDVRLGEVNRVKECSYVPGGKGLNVSKPAAISGSKVVATGFAAGHAGNYVKEALKEFGIESRFCELSGESRSCINIWDPVNKQQTEFLEPGPAVSAADKQRFLDRFTELVKDADVVSMSGSLPTGLDGSFYCTLIEIVKSLGKKVILDTSGSLLERGIEAAPTMVKPNEDEIRLLTGKGCKDMPELIAAAKEIHGRGVAFVAISLGKEGSLLVCAKGVYRSIVPRIDAVNTVGCGDAFVSGFAIGLSEGMTIEETLREASAISVASALNEKTGIFDPADKALYQEKIIIEKIS
ncbi:MAG: 1-phosphofructokinase family hexose kinase [Lachnospiraceae bacterium]|nr:1-phosphofructokinase family hexose kinase [Lachnospiraceae bacterium]